jgi:FAD synthetase
MGTSRKNIGDISPRGEAAMSITQTQCDNWRVYDSSTIQTHEEETTFPFDHTTYNGSTCWSNMHYSDALEFYNCLRECDDPYLAQQIKEALDCLDGAYRLYGPAHVIGSYNGGKDAVVVLHLMRAAHAHYYNISLNNNNNNNNNNNCLPRLRPRVVFFDHPDEFPEIIALLQETVGQYDLDMIQFTNTSFRQGLQILVSNPTRSQLAFVLGTRTSDPNSQSQGHFSPSSPYMPPFMRINPIFHWSYGQIWHFLRMFQLPYCYLYDQGYTSLGTVKDTLPCPALRRNSDDGSGTHYYMPAYTLNDWDQERAGRIHASSPTTICTNTSKVGPRQREQEPPSLLVCDYYLDYNSSSLQHQQRQQKDESSTGTNTEKSQSKTQPSNTNSTTTNELGGKGSCKTIVGLLIIGDEILKGLCSDSNIYNAANALRSNGLLLSKVVIVPDEQEDIVNEVSSIFFSLSYIHRFIPSDSIYSIRLLLQYIDVYIFHTPYFHPQH